MKKKKVINQPYAERNTVGGKRSLYEYKLLEKEEETLKRRSSEDSRSPNEPQTRKKNNSITDKVRMFSQKTDTKKLVTQEVYTESKYIRVYDENTKKYIWVIGKNMQNMDRKGSNENSVENASPSLKLVDKVKMYQTKSKNETNSELYYYIYFKKIKEIFFFYSSANREIQQGDKFSE